MFKTKSEMYVFKEHFPKIFLLFFNKGFDKKPTISVLHQLIRNGNAFLRVKGQREHVSIIGKALKPPKTTSTLGIN
jgi:hypothetical protein